MQATESTKATQPTDPPVDQALVQIARLLIETVDDRDSEARDR